MRFGVIYSVDVPSGVSVREYLPPRRLLRRKMWQTEGDEQYDYGYLEGRWERGKHRKIVGELSRPEFDELVDHLGLYATDVETMGSLGAPWTESGVGVAPAVSFDAEHDDALVNAYVTPLPEVKGPWGDRTWDRVRRALIAVYSRQGKYRARLRAHERWKAIARQCEVKEAR